MFTRFQAQSMIVDFRDTERRTSKNLHLRIRGMQARGLRGYNNAWSNLFGMESQIEPAVICHKMQHIWVTGFTGHHISPYLTISHHMSPCLRVFQEMPRAKSIQELHCFWILVPSFAQLDKCVSWEVRSLHFIPTQSSRLNKNMNQSDTAIHVCSVMRGMNPRQKAVKKRFWLI